MIGYVTLGTNDREKAGRFYDAVLGELGVGRMMDNDQFTAWGDPKGGTGLSATTPHDGKPASVGNGTMVALEAKDTAQVDRIHAIALANGGTCEGPPGERFPGFYAAYFRDPDGNKLNAFIMSQEALEKESL